MVVTEDTDGMTIDELAHRTGTPASTIRLYQSRGLLPAPKREGRIGFYGPQHLARMHLIARLQTDGFSLAGIGRLLDAWKEGRALDEVLGLEAQVAATWGAPEPLVLTAHEFAARLPGGDLSAELAQRALDLGLMRIEGDQIVIEEPKLLDVGTELAGLGVPTEVILDEFEALRALMNQVSARFVHVFREFIWAVFVEQGFLEGQLPDVVATLQRLSQLSESIVERTLRSALKQAAEGFVNAESKALAEHDLTRTIEPLIRAAGLAMPSEECE